MEKSQRVAILGASDDPDRYSFKAFEMLKEHGHTPVPVSPKLKSLQDIPVVAHLSEIQGPIDTLTMYVNPQVSTALKKEILAVRPNRIIFNPGSENPELASELEKVGTQVVVACTLVMLRTGQF